VFPGLTVELKAHYEPLNHGDWISLLLITTFNIGDFAGRYLAGITSFGFKPNNMYLGTFARIMLFPVFVLIYRGVVSNDALTFVSVAVLSISNGLFTCLSFMWGPELCEPHEREVGGAIMVCF